MRITRKYLRQMILEEVNILLEQEEETDAPADDAAEDAPADEPTGEAGGEDAPADDAAEDAPADEPIDKATGDDAEKDASKEDEPEIEITPEEEAMFRKSADDQILASIIGFETNAIKSAKLASDDKLAVGPAGETAQVSVESKWFRGKLSSLLFEESETIPGQRPVVGSPKIDMDVFAGDVARLVMNYDSLIDMEALIINKAKRYLESKYDQETADYFMELMDTQHDMRAADKAGIDTQDENPIAPQAVGSGFATQLGGG